jgi:hypothetical protein
MKLHLMITDSEEIGNQIYHQNLPKCKISEI